MLKVKLTSRQQEILDFIKISIETQGAPPTRVEISTAFGFASPNAAEEHLKALAKKGVITLEAGAARGIRLTEQLGLPLIGSVAAGSPILAIENIQAHFHLDSALFSPQADYLLKVRGNSMIDAGIFDGDMLVVHRSTEARNGQIVIARLGDDVTVKRYHRKGSIVELSAENADYPLITIDIKQQDLQIEGLAVGLIRGSNAL